MEELADEETASTLHVRIIKLSTKLRLWIVDMIVIPR